MSGHRTDRQNDASSSNRRDEKMKNNVQLCSLQLHACIFFGRRDKRKKKPMMHRCCCSFA
uniref:Uncharacterized protein n=1 Tax=Oryza brachyantha TaxID=4533 RepID=J3KU61_ORYBR